jgi:hypothetical protein
MPAGAVGGRPVLGGDDDQVAGGILELGTGHQVVPVALGQGPPELGIGRSRPRAGPQGVAEPQGITLVGPAGDPDWTFPRRCRVGTATGASPTAGVAGSPAGRWSHR